MNFILSKDTINRQILKRMSQNVRTISNFVRITKTLDKVCKKLSATLTIH